MVTWFFDTDAALLATRPFAPGTRYDYDNSSLVMTARVGSDPPVHFPFGGSPATSTANRILLRNESGDQLVNGQPADGISFGIVYDGVASIGLAFRTDDLNVVGGRVPFLLRVTVSRSSAGEINQLETPRSHRSLAGATLRVLWPRNTKPLLSARKVRLPRSANPLIRRKLGSP